MGFKVIVEPTLLAISVAEAKAHCEYMDNDRDSYFEDLIRAATDFVVRELEMSIMQRTLCVSYDEFTDEMELPYGPVSEVLAVEYVDETGVMQPLDTSAYTADLGDRSSWIVRNSASSYPVPLSAVNAVRVNYVAGVEEMPPSWASLKHAIKLMVGHFFANREAVTSGAVMEVPLHLKALVHNFRRFNI